MGCQECPGPAAQVRSLPRDEALITNKTTQSTREAEVTAAPLSLQPSDWSTKAPRRLSVGSAKGLRQNDAILLVHRTENQWVTEK